MARTKAYKSPAGPAKAPRKTLVVSGAKHHPPKSGAGARKPHRWRNGTVALREIRREQKSTVPLLRRAPFNRLVRVGLEKISADEMSGMRGQLRFNSEALQAIQEAVEAHQIFLLERTNASALHAKRVTVRHDDMIFTRGMVGLGELLVSGDKSRAERSADIVADREAKTKKKKDALDEKAAARLSVDRIHADIKAKTSAFKAADSDATDDEDEDDDDGNADAVSMDTTTTASEKKIRLAEEREAKRLSKEAGARIAASSASAVAVSSASASASASSGAPQDKADVASDAAAPMLD